MESTVEIIQISQALIIKDMTKEEAIECVDKINANQENTRHLLLDIYERKGWKAMGYENFRDCAAKVFNQKQSYLYYQLEAAQTERNISTFVENSDKIPEGQLRPLSKLEPAQQRIAWAKAVKTAPKGVMTAKHIKKVVKEMTKKPAETKNPEERKEPKKPKESKERKEEDYVEDTRMDEKFKFAWERLANEIKGQSICGWKAMTMDTALDWISKLTYMVENMKRSEERT